MLAKPLLVGCDGADSFRSAELAARLGLQRVENAAFTPAVADEAQLILWADAEGLALGKSREGRAAATRVDLADPALLYRLRTSGKRQGLGKAVGLDKISAGRQLHVLDATAGLGRDALLLAHLGCRVTLLEQSPLVHALLEEGLYQAARLQLPELQPALARMTLQHADARAWLEAVCRGEREQPDVVYLDPMFPPRNKSAKSRKDIALLHELLGAEQDLLSLLAAARAAARYRVVLKRPDGKLPEALPVPAFVVAGKTAGFAVYTNSSLSSMP